MRPGAQNSDNILPIFEEPLALQQSKSLYAPKTTEEALPKPPREISPKTLERNQQTIELLDISFHNIPTFKDQNVYDPKHPVAISEENSFPTVPMYNMKEHFGRFGEDTLFFAFYF